MDSKDEQIELILGEDYYMENGLMVLTSRYHLRRGYCCEQGCRHCPYGEAPARNSQRNANSNEE